MLLTCCGDVPRFGCQMSHESTGFWENGLSSCRGNCLSLFTWKVPESCLDQCKQVKIGLPKCPGRSQMIFRAWVENNSNLIYHKKCITHLFPTSFPKSLLIQVQKKWLQGLLGTVVVYMRMCTRMNLHKIIHEKELNIQGLGGQMDTSKKKHSGERKSKDTPKKQNLYPQGWG